ncbi:antiviral helicase [Cladochytrium replicatum]|nr:antiviral helicase [Cladochytrium replicatum]
MIDLPWDFIADGSGGEIQIIPRKNYSENGGSAGVSSIPTTSIPLELGHFGFEDVPKELESRFLIPSNLLDSDLLASAMRYWEPSIDPTEFLNIVDETLPATFEFLRTPGDFDIDPSRFIENLSQGDDARNSFSFQRKPNKQADFVRGRSSNMPFAPGGIEKVAIAQQKRPLSGWIDGEEFTIPHDLNIVPHGLDRGMITEKEPTALGKDIMHILSSNSVDADLHAWLLNPEPDAKPPSEKHDEDASEEHRGRENPNIDFMLRNSDSIARRLPPKRKATPPPTKQWAHSVDATKDFPEFNQLVPNMAHSFPFELDVFQKRAVYHLEQGDSVFVAAHTSAGKTVVAEYAIALARKHMTRTIYTSPIKALSNQKYRDFLTTFEDVGILTGDVQIRPEAACVIMTTEILRSMLYRGADLIRDVEFVIFDEVHYVNDVERGVVWEEVIIMLPAHVNLVLLSATVPNAFDFADWVGRTKKKDIYVIPTQKRPVPLEHYLYHDQEMYKIVSQSNFDTGGWKRLSDKLNDKKKPDTFQRKPPPSGGGDARGGRGGGPVGRGGSSGAGRGDNRNQQQRSGAPAGKSNFSYSMRSGPNQAGADKTGRSIYFPLINSFLKKRDLLPCIVFTFSKKKCEEFASTLSNVDLTSGAKEKSEIHLFFARCVSRLKGTDKELPQVLRTREMLSRGIAVHHSGLLPIIKEIVEILFTRGLVKVLFATETFAMGVNAPAKSVVFSSTRKHDGRDFRMLSPGEYIQMSGRAGRRGLDTTGTVLIVVDDEMPNQLDIVQMTTGRPTKLESQFRLTYNMILNLLRVEAFKVEEMIQRSFFEADTQKAIPDRQRDLEESAKALKLRQKLSCHICVDGDISTYYDLTSTALQLIVETRSKLVDTQLWLKALSIGRVVVVNTPLYRNVLGIVLSSDPGAQKSKVVLLTDKSLADKALPPILKIFVPILPNAVSVILSITNNEIVFVSNIQLRVNHVPILMGDPNALLAAVQDLLEVGQNHVGPGLIEEFDWSKLRDIDFHEKRSALTQLKHTLGSFPCLECPDLVQHFAITHEEKELAQKIRDLSNLDQNLHLLPDYHRRVEVLKVLSFIEEDETVKIKGRVACEINTADELILSELILDNILGDYEPAEIVALLSAFVFQEKRASEPSLTLRLEQGTERMKEIAVRVAEVQRQCGLPVAVDEVVEGLHFGLVEVVYEWARGTAFKEITELTDVLEGSIVRCIVRLDETCRDVRNAARIIGDTSLYRKMEEASEAIKRDIVFAASLYHSI